MASDIFQALSPLQYLNIPQIYSSYSAVFDFFIFLVLFVGLARVAFERRFEGKGGNAVIVGVGIALALGLSVAEAKFGFSLGSFGGIAAAVLVIAFGFLLFNLLSSLGFHKATALAWSYVLLFIFLNSISQTLASWIQRKFPILNLLFLIACLFVIIKGITSLGPGSPLKDTAKSLLSKGAEFARQIPLKEEKLERKVLREEAKSIHKENAISSRMLKKLYDIRQLIKEFGGSEKGRKAVARQIESLSSDENKLLQKLTHLRDLDKQLEELDILAMRKLKEEYGEVPEQLRAKIAGEIQAERDKLGLNLKMEDLENAIKTNIEGFNQCIRLSIEYLGKFQIFEAVQSIDRSIVHQTAIDKLFEEMDKIGGFMIGLTKREFKEMKKGVKKAA